MTVRRIATALALPAFPLILFLSSLISPTDSDDNAAQLRAAAAHGSAWTASTLLELLAAIVLAVAVAGVVLAVRGRGVGLANAGGLLGAMGAIGLAGIAYRHVFIYGMATADRGQALNAINRVDGTFGAPVLLLMFAAPIGLVVLASAAVRAELAPRWVPFAAFVFFVSDMLPIPGAELIQGGVGVATFAVIAWGILRGAPDAGRAPVRQARSDSPLSANA